MVVFRWGFDGLLRVLLASHSTAGLRRCAGGKATALIHRIIPLSRK
uniref:Uncharacterized protein n=1 Tax=Anguilla anguilla TaxID=7936 RepID=A0A0E9XN03_ANGAN